MEWKVSTPVICGVCGKEVVEYKYCPPCGKFICRECYWRLDKRALAAIREVLR